MNANLESLLAEGSSSSSSSPSSSPPASSSPLPSPSALPAVSSSLTSNSQETAFPLGRNRGGDPYGGDYDLELERLLRSSSDSDTSADINDLSLVGDDELRRILEAEDSDTSEDDLNATTVVPIRKTFKTTKSFNNASPHIGDSEILERILRSSTGENEDGDDGPGADDEEKVKELRRRLEEVRDDELL